MQGKVEICGVNTARLPVLKNEEMMALLRRAGRLSIFGISIAGAAAHNCGQVCAALITLGSTAPLYYLPFLLLVSLFTGAFSGLITACLFRAMAHTPYGTKGENHHG